MSSANMRVRKHGPIGRLLVKALNPKGQRILLDEGLKRPGSLQFS